jgi:hypothetical protein
MRGKPKRISIRTNIMGGNMGRKFAWTETQQQSGLSRYGHLSKRADFKQPTGRPRKSARLFSLRGDRGHWRLSWWVSAAAVYNTVAVAPALANVIAVINVIPNQTFTLSDGGLLNFNTETMDQSEPSVAVDPANPQTAVITTFGDVSWPTTEPVFVTTNGGTTWGASNGFAVMPPWVVTNGTTVGPADQTIRLMHKGPVGLDVVTA